MIKQSTGIVVTAIRGDVTSYAIVPNVDELKHCSLLGDAGKDISMHRIIDAWNKMLTLPQDLAKKWGLRMADDITFQFAEIENANDPKKRTGYITNIISVNGYCFSEEECSCRRTYEQYLKDPINPPKYPSIEIDFDILGDPITRTLRLLMGIGLGTLCMISGPFNSGKTTTAQAILRGVVECIHRGLMPKDHRFKIISLQAGERNVDIPETRDVVTMYPDVDALHFSTSIGVNRGHATTNLARYVRALVERFVLEGYHVIAVIDSISGLLQEGYQKTCTDLEGITSGGTKNSALSELREHFATAGYTRRSSLTVLTTALVGDNSRMNTALVEAAGALASSQVIHTMLAEHFPKLDIGPLGCNYRKSEKFVDQTSVDVRKAIKAFITNGGRQPANLILRKYIEFATNTEGLTWEQAVEKWRKQGLLNNSPVDEMSAFSQTAGSLLRTLDPTLRTRAMILAMHVAGLVPVNFILEIIGDLSAKERSEVADQVMTRYLSGDTPKKASPTKTEPVSQNGNGAAHTQVAELPAVEQLLTTQEIKTEWEMLIQQGRVTFPYVQYKAKSFSVTRKEQVFAKIKELEREPA